MTPLLKSIGADNEALSRFNAMLQWKNKVRFIGAGTIGIAAIWTLITLLKPTIEGMKQSFRTLSGNATVSTARIEQDLSPQAMIFITLGMMVLLGFSFYHFIDAATIPSGIAWLLVIVCVLLTVIIGFLVAAACGYMAGLVGSSSSPISGIGIISIIIISLVLLLIGESGGLFADDGNRRFLLALTLFCGSAVVCVASISNDNLQDLKTGYLLQATPWRQQVALIIGVVVGAIVVAPVLQLLYQAYGFPDAMPRAGMNPAQAMSAPQATLMTSITQGIFEHKLQWQYILSGVAIGVALIVVDVLLRKGSGGPRATRVRNGEAESERLGVLRWGRFTRPGTFSRPRVQSARAGTLPSDRGHPARTGTGVLSPTALNVPAWGMTHPAVQDATGCEECPRLG